MISSIMLRSLLLLLLVALTTTSADARSSRSKRRAQDSQAADESAGKANATPAPESAAAPVQAAPTLAATAATAATAAPASGEPTANPAGAAPSGSAKAAGPAEPPRKLTQEEVESTLSEASTLFKSGQHEQAARKLLLVYDTSPQPILLFNAGQAFRRAKLPRDAKDCYVRFLEAAPQSPLGPEVRGYVRDMDTLIEMQQREQDISLQLKQEQAAATSAQQALQKERSTPVYKRSWFWVTMISVGVAVVAGVTVAGAIGSRTKADLTVNISN